MSNTKSTMTTPPPATKADWPAAPEGVPAPRWQRAVELIRSQAETAPSYWVTWCAAYRRHLRGFGDGRAFYGLFEVYESAGGRSRPYGRAPVMAVPGPDVAADEREQAGVTAEPFGVASAGESHVDAIAVMDIDPRWLGSF